MNDLVKQLTDQRRQHECELSNYQHFVKQLMTVLPADLFRNYQSSISDDTKTDPVVEENASNTNIQQLLSNANSPPTISHYHDINNDNVSGEDSKDHYQLKQGQKQEPSKDSLKALLEELIDRVQGLEEREACLDRRWKLVKGAGSEVLRMHRQLVSKHYNCTWSFCELPTLLNCVNCCSDLMGAVQPQ